MNNKRTNESSEVTAGCLVAAVLSLVIVVFLMFFLIELFISHDVVASFWVAAKILGYLLGGGGVVLLVGLFFTSDPDEVMVVGVIALVVIGILYKVLRVIF